MFPIASFRSRCIPLLLAAVVGFCTLSASTVQANEPPEIVSFTWYNPAGDYFVFYGFVADEIPGACAIEFNGLIAGWGASPEYDGYFFAVVEFPPGTIGNVTAEAVDNVYQFSEEVSTFVFY